MSDPTMQTLEPAEQADHPSGEPIEDTILEDVLVEEISIDGMCGVY